MSGENEFGKCQVCGKEGIVERTYFRYDIKCECHSPQHFEIIWHCNTCIPKEPSETKLSIKTKILKSMNHPTIPEAIQVITNAMLEDKEEGSYYYSWQANIAMAFVDEYDRWAKQYNVVNDHPIHSIANQAAKNFLDLLCSRPDVEAPNSEQVV